MNTTELIDALSKPSAYSFPAARVDFVQTHISLVFLVGDTVYKVKKPVALGFLDFSTLAKRKHFCEEEVRLNQRLAPSVYLGVVPIAYEEGQLRVEGTGEAVEWAVKMVRLPADATLEHRVDSGQATASEMAAVAQLIARFHGTAVTSAVIASFGSFDVVAGNARENFEQARPEIGLTVHADVFEHLRRLTEKQLERLHSIIEARAKRGLPRDTHGDLHLDHVYHFPDRSPPDDWAIIDCIEFNERFRYADPVADMAFLVMDLKLHGRPDLAQALADAYFQHAGDEEGRALVAFYSAYRSIVRAKVGGIKLREPEVGKRDRSEVLLRSRAHWLLALSELEEPARQPCLLLIGGMSGTGKSTLARLLAERHGFEIIRSDVARKSQPLVQRAQADLYSLEQTDRTYAECLRQARDSLFAGKRVIVDATFRQEKHRMTFVDAARELCVFAHWFDCQADPEVAKLRIATRKNDPSDADWAVYQSQAATWEPAGEKTQAIHSAIDTNDSPEAACDQAESFLRGLELL